MIDFVFENSYTQEQYIVSPTDDGRIKLYSMDDDTGRHDIIVDVDVFNRNYTYLYCLS